MIAGWGEPPDHASVNLGEAGAPAVIERPRRRGVGVEAGLASAADAERLAWCVSGSGRRRAAPDLAHRAGSPKLRGRTIAEAGFRPALCLRRARLEQQHARQPGP